MPEYPLDFASRHLKRVFARAVGKSIPKILTELITNADDSYRRIIEAAQRSGEKPNIEDPAPIIIVFERKKKKFCVIDHAEGLTDKEMLERFVTYGRESQDRSLGFKTRSLFGKGLRDVLFTQYRGQVKSIKDNLFFNCQFRWKGLKGEEKPYIDIKAPCRATNELRTALCIPENGTLVEFQLAEGVHNPQADKLIENLNRFYLLRLINSSPNRDVVLRVAGSKGNILQEIQLNYRFPDIETRDQFMDEFSTDTGGRINIEGEIGVTARELTQGERGYVEREGGLLVLDEDDDVLDLSLFGYDEDPAARRISGILRLKGAGAYIRSKLNQKEPEEILTETRDGFEKNHPFFRLLQDRIKPRMAPIIDSIKKSGYGPKLSLSERTLERHRQAFKIINQLAKDMLGKIGKLPIIPGQIKTPPQDGIAFATTHISVQTNVSTPTALLINTNIIRPTDVIEIRSSRSEISVVPQMIIIEGDENKSNLLIKIIRIRSDTPNINGDVIASYKAIDKVLSVSTIDREVITPMNGLEFSLDEYAVRLNSLRHLRLFIDVEKIPLGREIAIFSESAAVQIVNRKVVARPLDLLTKSVAQVDVAIKGLRLSKGTIVTASQSQYGAGARVSVVKKEKAKHEMQGLFKDYKFVSLERKVQSQWDGQEFILINTNDPVNKHYFGDDPYKAVEEYTHCQVRLADLILNECLQILVSRALEDGKLDRRFPDNPETDIRSYVDEKKYDVGLMIHRLFVTRT